jgi:ketosteroid isomerase-like protein
MRVQRTIGGIAVAVLLLVVAGCATSGDRKDDAAQIAALNQKWLGLVARKDAEAIGKLYAANGAILMSNGPTATGPKAVGEAWAGIMKLPNVSLNFRTTQLTISRSGDLASDRGTYDLAFDGDKGRVRDIGKYVVVWTKVDGKWKVLADIYNSDTAM